MGRTELTFIRPKNVQIDRYLLPTREQQLWETEEQFHLALRSLAEHCQLAHPEDELLRHVHCEYDRPQNPERFAKMTLTPEKVRDLAVSIELGIRSQLAIQSRQLPDLPQNALNGHDEIISERLSARYRVFNRATATPRRLHRGNNRPTNNNSRSAPHNCRNCGEVWDMKHRAKCQAMGQTCRRCNKPNHFAKVCKSNLNRPQTQRSINEVDNQISEQSPNGINMISPQAEIYSTYGDSADDYSLNMMDTTDDPTTPSNCTYNTAIASSG